MECLDPMPTADGMHLVFLQLCVSLSISLLVLLPLGFLLMLVLCRAKKVHQNTRLLLAIIPAVLLLELVPRTGKLFIFHLLLQHDLLAAHSVHQQEGQKVLCQSHFPLSIEQILHWAIKAPTFLGHFLLNSLPLAILIEQFFATIFYKHYEKGQRFLWLGIGIFTFQIIFALLYVASHSLAISAHHEIKHSTVNFLAKTNIGTLLHPVVILLSLVLLAINNKLSKQLTGPSPDSGIVCTLSKGTSPRLVSCRYQLRENRRSLHFCVLLTALMCATAFANLLLGIIFTDGQNNNITMLTQITIFGELHELGPPVLATLCTLLGHESFRHTLLTQMGVRCQRPKSKSKLKSAGICLMAVTNTSASSSNHSNSNSADLMAQQQQQRRGNFSRISDAQSLNEVLRHAHFDALQDFWAQNGPDEKSCKKAKEAKKGGQLRNNCKIKSAPCSTAMKE